MKPLDLVAAFPTLAGPQVVVISWQTLLLGALVTGTVALSIHFWNEVATTHPQLTEVQLGLGENSFAGRFADHLARRYGIRFEKQVPIALKKKNFCIPKRRWLVERTLAWLSTNRRLAKEYDLLLTHANAWVMWANMRQILKYC